MDFQAEMKQAGQDAREIGFVLIEAAKQQDIDSVRAIRDQLSNIITKLNVILLADNIAQSRKRRD